MGSGMNLGALMQGFTQAYSAGQARKVQREEMELQKKILTSKLAADEAEQDLKKRKLSAVMAALGGLGLDGAAPAGGAAPSGIPEMIARETTPGLPSSPAAAPAPGGSAPAGGSSRIQSLMTKPEGQIALHELFGFVPKPQEITYRSGLKSPTSGQPVTMGFDPFGKPINEMPEAERPETAQQRFTQSKTLRGEFTDISKTFRDVRDSFARIQESAESPSAAGDLALIFNYMKMLDPGSTVREGEFANAQNSGGVPDVIRAHYNKLMSGERLSEPMRSDFLGRAEMLYNRQTEQYDQNVTEYTRLADQLGIDPREVIVDFRLAQKKNKSMKTPPKLGGKKAASAMSNDELLKALGVK
jgi:hypothetical protein